MKINSVVDRPFNVVFVDDEVEALTLIRHTLKLEIHAGKINILTFASGEECLDYLNKNHADLLVFFTDIKMPLMDGFTLMEKVRELHPHVDMFFISAYDLQDYKVRANQMGAKGYFTKPINLKAIQAIINSYF